MKLTRLAWLVPILMPCASCSQPSVHDQLVALVDSTGAEVGVWFQDLNTGDTLAVNADLRMHAASTMKVPVMIQVYRDVEAGRFDTARPLRVVNRFHSIVDSSIYALDRADDSDSSLYMRIGDTMAPSELLELMITVSSNLATNILIDQVDPRRVTATMRALGADSIQVLRGVEDIKAFDAGLSNTTTARDLGVIMAAIAEGRAAGPASTDSMLAILRRQHFNEGIPAGLPADAVVAHKTGWITGIHHDAAYVTTPGGKRYVLVVMIRGITSDTAAARLQARVATLLNSVAAALPARSHPAPLGSGGT